MSHSHVTPLHGEILRYQPPVTVLRLEFAAKQDSRYVEELLINDLFHLTLCEKGDEALLVFVPGNFLFLVGVQNVFSGGKNWFMKIFGPAEFLEKVLEVFALGKAGEL